MIMLSLSRGAGIRRLITITIPTTPNILLCRPISPIAIINCNSLNKYNSLRQMAVIHRVLHLLLPLFLLYLRCINNSSNKNNLNPS